MLHHSNKRRFKESSHIHVASFDHRADYYYFENVRSIEWLDFAISRVHFRVIKCKVAACTTFIRNIWLIEADACTWPSSNSLWSALFESYPHAYTYIYTHVYTHIHSCRFWYTRVPFEMDRIEWSFLEGWILDFGEEGRGVGRWRNIRTIKRLDRREGEFYRTDVRWQKLVAEKRRASKVARALSANLSRGYVNASKELSVNSHFCHIFIEDIAGKSWHGEKLKLERNEVTWFHAVKYELKNVPSCEYADSMAPAPISRSIYLVEECC